MKTLFTSESVSEGHPDKVADQISDAILDAILRQDKNARVACETLVTTGQVIIAGEVRTNAYVSVEEIARGVIRDIGYTGLRIGFDADSCGVLSSLHEQSPDIAMGVDNDEEQGAGDQGMMFGFATNETAEYMPLPLMLSHKLLMHLAHLRKNNILSYLRPDAKSQVTVEYVDGVAQRIDAIVISTQHTEDVTLEEIRRDMIEKIIPTVVDPSLLDEHTKYFINPTGRFVIGGPMGDCGLTGRKIVVDTYGGMGRVGGGAFSGKDPSKVDRSGAYLARYIAKNIVAAGIAPLCEVQISYAIGVAEPVSIYVDTFGKSSISDELLTQVIREIFPLKPRAIIEQLHLLDVTYRNTAAYGHFGRDEFPWEKLDKVELLQQRLTI